MTFNPDLENKLIGVAEAARIIGIREDSLKELADLGRIPCVRQHNGATGNAHRMFKEKDLILYKHARIERLRAELACAQGGSLNDQPR